MTLIALGFIAVPLFLVGFIVGHAQARKSIAETARRLGAFHVGAAVFRVVEAKPECGLSSYPGAPRNPHRQTVAPVDSKAVAKGEE